MRIFYRYLIAALLLSFYAPCIADEIHLRYVKSPVSEILTKIRDAEHLSISFDPRELNKYRITLDTVFADAVSAVRFVIKDLPFKVTDIEGVIVISTNQSHYTLIGSVVDSESGESLPYATIVHGSKVYVSDVNGLFNISLRDNVQSTLSVSYLGYRVHDTIINTGSSCRIKLKPIHLDIKELLFEDYETGRAMQAGEEPGMLRINHLIAQYLPGNGDNSVFNLMRMMPGVRAGGEPSELTVWGSKPGESSIIFDGFRLFSMNGFNEQISSINPYMVKEIRVMKGGYGPSYGNQTGAIADISGIEGSRKNPFLKLNVNNLTANIFGSVPIGNKATLSAAYRQTYYGLYDVTKLNPFGKRKDNLYVTPEYQFRDANIKLSGVSSDNDRYYISLYGASDNFEYSLSGNNIDLDAFENNAQFAAGGGYSKVWSGGANSGLSLRHSQLDNSNSKVIQLNRQNYLTIAEEYKVEESGVKLNHSFLLLNSNNLEIGAGAERLSVRNNEVSGNENKGHIYLNDRLSLYKFNLAIGIRADYYKDDFYIQPRLSMKYSITENLATSLSWGIYNQFLGKVPVIYETGTTSLIWHLLGSGEFPISGSAHSILNLTYSSPHFLISLDGYNKNTWGLTRIYRNGNRNTIANGKSLITGADIFAKWESKGSQLFGSFSIAKANEIYLMDIRRSFAYNPFEAKIGALWNLSPFFLSAEYVYSQGFPEAFATGKYSGYSEEVYNRLDISATFSLRIKGAECKTGFSILNVFNSPNIKTLDILPSAGRGNQTTLVNLYSESVPFTPTLFFQISL